MFNPILFYEYGKQYTNFLIAVFDTTKTSTGSSASNQVKLPLVNFGTYDFYVDWGDGVIQHITAYNQAEVTHTYAVAGEYTIHIKNNAGIWQFNNSGDRLKLKEIKSFGFLKITSLSFFGCANLTLANVSGSPTFYNNSINGVFQNCTSLTTINNVENWNVSSIINFSGAFQGCTNFNQNIDSWNISGATNIGAMFYGCSNFNQPLDNWNTGNVTTMANIFQDCINFNQNINSWDVSKVTNFSNVFFNCRNFNQPLNNWNVGNVTNFTSTFYNCYAFNQNINSWNTAKVTTALGMFQNAYAYNQPMNSWDVSKITNMTGMFRNATAFNQNLSAWNFNKNVVLTVFMADKTSANYSAINYDALLNKLQIQLIGTGRTQATKTFGMGTIKYTNNGSSARAALVSDSWVISDGGLMPNFQVLFIGDSTIAAFSCRSQSIAQIFLTPTEIANGFSAVSIATAGHNIQQQTTQWNSYSEKNIPDVIIVQVGLNNCNPSVDTVSQNRTYYQTLVNSIKASKKTGAKIVLSCMLPCKARWAMYGNPSAAQNLWTQLNDDIMNDYFGIVDYKNNAHVALLDDGNGNLNPIYDCGDNIHENNDGAQIIKNSLRSVIGL